VAQGGLRLVDVGEHLARQLDSPGIVNDITEALEASGLDHHRLVVEITESTLMRDPASTVERISQLKALGIRVAVDDFGTGTRRSPTYAGSRWTS